MILFDKANPLDELAHVVRLANPETAKDITGADIAVDNIKVIDPIINEGFNTECEVRMVGVGSAVGLVKVRFTRIDLRNYVPSENNAIRTRVGVVTATNKRADMTQIAPRISKALGTMFDNSGPHKDYTNTGTYVIQKGAIYLNYLDISADSLRYVPCRWYFHSFGLGMDIEPAVSQPAVVPFLNTDDTAKYGGWEPPIKYVPSENKRSAIMTMGMLDFGSVWGTDPSLVIELTNDPAKGKWKFKDDAFVKINLLLETAGLPPLPHNHFAQWGSGGTNINITPRSAELNYHFFIHKEWCTWDYHTAANLHGETTNHRDYHIFAYRT